MSSPSDRRSHILVVDDDPAVLDATRLLLMLAGYYVNTAPSFAQAIDKANRHRDIDLLDIDLLITDLHIGSDQGTDLIRSVRAIVGNQLKAVVATADIGVSEGQIESDNGIRLVRKPLRAEELLGLIEELLGAEPVKSV